MYVKGELLIMQDILLHTEHINYEHRGRALSILMEGQLWGLLDIIIYNESWIFMHLGGSEPVGHLPNLICSSMTMSNILFTGYV